MGDDKEAPKPGRSMQIEDLKNSSVKKNLGD